MRILDLCAGSNSVHKALNNIDYIGVDITGDNLILDLSRNNIIEVLKEKLPRGWMPDFIWASPPCNKFSLATAVRGGNLYFQKYGDGVIIRRNFEVLKYSIYKNSEPGTLKEAAVIALKILHNVLEIIKFYNVPYAIENPTRAYTHYFIDIGHRNKTNYCAYGYDYKKPTSIWSNKKLSLKTCTHKTHSAKIGSRTTLAKYGENQSKVSNYYDKSSVPPQLIQEIYNELLGGS